MINKNRIILLLLLVLVSGCIEEYFPEMDNVEEKIVIDGILTDEAGRQRVRISWSSYLDTPLRLPVTGCLVQVVDNESHLFTFAESSDGLYIRDFAAGEVVLGRSYSLRVVTPEGKEYETDYLPMNGSVPIDSVSYREESVFSFEEDFNDEGVRFYVDIDAAGSDSRYFAFRLTETWETYSPFKIEFVYDSGRIYTAYDYLSVVNHCWITSEIDNFFVATTEGSVSNKVTDVPLHYVNTKSSRLKYRYSLLVNQLSITKDAFEYYNSLNNQSFESAGLYETQARQLYGNICNVNNPDELVLGFFVVASTQSKRVFINEKFNFVFHDYSDCNLVDAQLRFFKDMTAQWPIYLSYPSGDSRQYGYAQKRCFDCTYSGGVIERPIYWDEE